MNDAAADGDLLHAPLVIEYGFMRTTGPVIGAFLTALQEQRVLGIRGADGRVVCPPVEYDPTTGAPPTRSMAGRMSLRSRAKVVAGSPMSWRLSTCMARSLSRELAMPLAVFGV